MKKSLLLCLFFLLYENVSHAFNEFFPTGTQWAETVVELGMPLEKISVREYEVGQDTLIDGILYKKILENGSENGLWVREDSNKVFLLSQDSPQEILLYDFNWESVATVTQSYLLESETGFYVTQETLNLQAKGTVCWNDKEFDYYNGDDCVIIEGIGRIMERDRNSCLFGYKKSEMTLPGVLYHKLLWLSIRGSIVYQSEQIEDWLTTILTNLHQTVLSKGEHSDNQLYDLQGCRRVCPPVKGIYIQNGRKVVR